MTGKKNDFVIFVPFVVFVPERAPSAVDTYGS